MTAKEILELELEDPESRIKDSIGNYIRDVIDGILCDEIYGDICEERGYVKKILSTIHSTTIRCGRMPGIRKLMK